MNNPIMAAVTAFTVWVGTTVLVSYFKHREVPWGIEIASGLLFALGVYALTQRNQQKTHSDQTPDDSGTE